MSTGSFCVPSPCTFIPPNEGCDFEWCIHKCCNVTILSLYSLGYVASQYAPILVAGIPGVLENEAGSWLVRRTIIAAIPYTVTLIVLFIVLMVMGTISIVVGILLIVLLIILVIVCVTWMVHDISSTVSGAFAQVQAQFNQNWAANGSMIATDIQLALRDPHSLECTGGTGDCSLRCPTCPPPEDAPLTCIGCEISCPDCAPGSTDCTGCTITCSACEAEAPPPPGPPDSDIAALAERYRREGEQYMQMGGCNRPGGCRGTSGPIAINGITRAL